MDFEVQFLADMIGIQSYSGKEAKLAQYLEGRMKEFGFTVQKDEVGNVIGEIGAGNPITAFCGHMDTIPEPAKRHEVTGDKIFGRGAVDAKSALASQIISAYKFSEGGNKGKVLVFAVVDEEGMATGVRHLLKTYDRYPKFTSVVFGEPSGVDDLTVGYRGWINYRFTCSTPQTGHTGASWRFTNAVDVLCCLKGLIDDYQTEKKVQDDNYHSLHTTVTYIKGGEETHSLVPQTAEMMVNIRVPPSLTIENVKTKMDALIEKTLSEYKGAKITITVDDEIPPYEADEKNDIVSDLSDAVRDVRGVEPKLLRKTGTGDMNILGSSLGIPTVTYGPGDSRMDHMPTEYVMIPDYLGSIAVLHRLLEKRANRFKLS